MNFHFYVNQKLENNGFIIRQISEEYMHQRLHDLMQFVNGIRLEYADLYGWQPETEAYFLNGLCRKWDFSFAIEKKKEEEICFVSLSSVNGDVIHLHCAYGLQRYRNMNFGKLHMVKQCQTAIDAGFTHQEGYWPKHNNGSLTLYLRMGWKIEEIRKQGTQVFMVADLVEVRDKAYQLIVKDTENN